LLGWHKPSEGCVLVDGEQFGAEALARLRGMTAWVDPQVQIWNSSLYSNILYGDPGDAAFDEILGAAELMGVVQTLPNGLQTLLGEGGGLVSGGEGQRVRLGRGFARAQVRLAVLDEPARGLDRNSRREMIRRARERWRDATLLCITHDISDTQAFDRVLVIDGARLVEDGHPSVLAANETSSYRKLLDGETALRRKLWSSPTWRHLRLENGKLEEGAREIAALECETKARANSSTHVSAANEHLNGVAPGVGTPTGDSKCSPVAPRPEQQPQSVRNIDEAERGET
jgi:ABC-type multidrug transport system ATPase subunit